MFNTLLLAVDVNDPEDAVRSAQAAARMAKSEGAALHVINVVPDAGMAIVSASLQGGHSSEALERAKKDLDAWVAANIPAGIETLQHVTRGTVYDQIIKLADKLEVDGIFVGAHRPQLKDYLIGPNAARVARHASQSVFVIR